MSIWTWLGSIALRGIGTAVDSIDERRDDFGANPADVSARIAKLSAGQLDCLRLVDEHLNSKEIAAELGMSPHTVDQRIRQALSILGVERRTQAARIVAAHRNSSSEPYQRLIHQSPYIETIRGSAHPQEAVSHHIRHAGRAGEPGGAGFQTEQRPAFPWTSLQPPFASRSAPSNEMSVGQRLFWIAAIAMGAAFSAGIYLAGLESLARLVKH